MNHLNNSGENIHERDEHKIIQSSGIGHLGQILPGFQAHEGHGEYSGDTWSYYHLLFMMMYVCITIIFKIMTYPGIFYQM